MKTVPNAQLTPAMADGFQCVVIECGADLTRSGSRSRPVRFGPLGGQLFACSAHFTDANDDSDEQGDFSERVRTRALVAIEASGHSHQEIATKSGVPLRRIEQQLSGVKPWSVTDLTLVAIAAGFTASSVVEGCGAVESGEAL